MATVSIDEAAKTLPALLQRARSESITILDEEGDGVLLLSLKPKSEEDRQKAIAKWVENSKLASAALADSLSHDGISVEDFLADALADD